MDERDGAYFSIILQKLLLWKPLISTEFQLRYGTAKAMEFSTLVIDGVQDIHQILTS